MTNSKGGRGKRKSRQQRMQNLLWIGGVILLLGVALVLPAMFSGVDVSGVHTYQMTNGTSIGDPNAPVQLTEFSDFRCSHCQNFAKESEQLLLEEYVYTGLVYYTYRTAGAFLGPESQVASEAAYCAEDQGMFWEYHEVLFTVTQFTNGYLTDIAEDMGMDGDVFSSCLSNGDNEARATADYDEARERIDGTPGFFVNGVATNSGSNYELLKQAIEAALP